jgi:hypothetical protein
MAAEPDPQQLLTVLTTEHFTLQGAPSETVRRKPTDFCRAALYFRFDAVI